MSRCLDSCKRPTPAQAHCATCHVTFGGVSNFDRHRSNGRCLPPASLGLTEREDVWREEMDHDKVTMFRERVRKDRTSRQEHLGDSVPVVPLGLVS